MARMEFLGENQLNTTTQVIVDSSSDLAAYLFDRNTELGYTTVGYDSTTSTVISIEFPEPTVLSHVLLQGHNLKSFSVFYNSATASSLYSVTTNSATDSYIAFNSVTVSSIQIQLNSTIAGHVEKVIGELVLAERQLVFERNPTQRKWAPTIFRKQVEHEMPDGGTVLFNIKDKYRASLYWDYVADTFYDGLLSVFSTGFPLYFLPFPTTTAWDGKANEVAWVGDFDFKHATNDKDQGFSGSMLLKETPGG